MVCNNDIWKKERVLDLWMARMVSSFGVLVVVGCQTLSSIGCPGVLPRSDSFNDNDFSFGEPPWRSTKLHISDGAASSLGEEVIRRSSFWWLLWSCWGQVTERWCLAQRCFAIFQFCHVDPYVACTLIFMI